MKPLKDRLPQTDIHLPVREGERRREVRDVFSQLPEGFLNTLPLGLQGLYGDVIRPARAHIPLNFWLSKRERILIRHGWDTKGNVPSFVLDFFAGITQSDDN